MLEELRTRQVTPHGSKRRRCLRHNYGYVVVKVLPKLVCDSEAAHSIDRNTYTPPSAIPTFMHVVQTIARFSGVPRKLTYSRFPEYCVSHSGEGNVIRIDSCSERNEGADV